jgi:Tol biopolymer transport system component
MAFAAESLEIVSINHGKFQIWIVNRDGTGPARLASDALNDLNPAWSPYGTRMAFASDAPGKPQTAWGPRRRRSVDRRIR